MSRPLKFTCVLLAVIFIAYHLISLSYFPLPGEEETFLASIALNFKNYGTFVPAVHSGNIAFNENFASQPVYFILTGLSFKVIGFGIFQFRVINLLAGLILIWTFSKCLIRANSSYANLLIITSAFLVDPLLQQSMHGGQSLLLGLTFILSSAVVLLTIPEHTDRKISVILLSGLLSLLALFTSPVMIIIFLSLTFVLLIWLFKNLTKKHLLHFILWFLPVVLIYTIAIWMIYGGTEEALTFVKNLFNEKAGGFLGFQKTGLHIPNTEWILIVSAIFCLLYKLNSDELKLDLFYLFSLLSIILTYVISMDPGTLTLLTIPFYYYIIADPLKNISFKDIRNPFWYLALIVLVVNLSLFALNGLLFVKTIGQSEYKNADAFVKNNIPPGSKVVGDALYFYSVKKAGSEFQFIAKQPEKDLVQNDFDFLIITDQLRSQDPERVVRYFTQAKFRKVARLGKDLKQTGKIPNYSTGYNADLYVRLKFDQPLPTAIMNVEF